MEFDRKSGLIKRGLSQHTILFLQTGLCGGFTTFSTFSLESYHLLQSNHILVAVVYMILSVALCLIGVFGGMNLASR